MADVEIKGFKHHETPKAIYFEIAWIGEEEVDPMVKKWFPISQISRTITQPKTSEEFDSIFISSWLADRTIDELFNS